MSELLPCPFCGGKAQLHPPTYSDENPSEIIGPACVNCHDCCAAVIDTWEDDAIAAWNRRAARPTAPAAEWQEPPLTCPHIDAAEASGELSEAVLAELATIRDINSHLRYGTWALKAQLEAALAARSAPEAGKAVDASLIERLKKWSDPTEFERLMTHWNSWRKYIKEGGGASWPRDAFESILDAMNQDAAEALSALASPAPSGEAEGWRDMESAPKDGTRIDVWCLWPEGNEQRRTPDAFWNGDDWQLGQYARGHYVYPPKILFWRPLPAAPTSEGSHHDG